MSVMTTARTAARGVRWFFTNLMGDNAYATYVSHQNATHPGEPVMSEREFWRQRYQAQASEPRCC